jgi:hypothetical protein
MSSRPMPTGVSTNIADLYRVNQKIISTYHLDRPFAPYDDDLRSSRSSLGNYAEGMGALYKGSELERLLRWKENVRRKFIGFVRTEKIRYMKSYQEFQFSTYCIAALSRSLPP